MKKLLIAAAALVAVALLGPLACGQFAERRANALIDEMLEQVPYLAVTERSWDRGWFTARQTLTVRSALPGMGAGAEELTIHNDVLHGPVLGLAGFGAARVRTTVDLPEALRAKIRAAFGEQPALDVVTRMGFLGGGSTVIRSQGRTLPTTEEGLHVTYETGRLEVDFSGDLDRYEMEGHLPRLEMRGRNGQLVLLEGLTLDGEGQRLAEFDYLSDGDFALRAAAVEFSGPGGAFKLEKIHYEGDTDVDDDLMGIELKLGSGPVASSHLAEVDLDVREVHYDFSLRRLHAQTVDQFYGSMQDFYRQLSAGPQGQAALLDDEAVMAQGFIEPLKQHAGALLEHDPELRFDRVGFTTPDGEALLTGAVRVVGLTMAEIESAGLAALSSRLQAEFTCELAQALVEKIPNGATMVGAGLDNGFLVREGGKLVARVQFRDGKLTINGQERDVPLPGLAPVPGSEGPPLPAPADMGA